MQEKLRSEVKQLRWKQDITYKEIAELLEIRADSFYSFLRGNYDLGTGKEQRLTEIIGILKE